MDHMSSLGGGKVKLYTLASHGRNFYNFRYRGKVWKIGISVYVCVWVCVCSIRRKDYRLHLSSQTKILRQMLFWTFLLYQFSKINACKCWEHKWERKPLAKGYNLSTLEENDLEDKNVQHRTWNKRFLNAQNFIQSAETLWVQRQKSQTGPYSPSHPIRDSSFNVALRSCLSYMPVFFLLIFLLLAIPVFPFPVPPTDFLLLLLQKLLSCFDKSPNLPF